MLPPFFDQYFGVIVGGGGRASRDFLLLLLLLLPSPWEFPPPPSSSECDTHTHTHTEVLFLEPCTQASPLSSEELQSTPRDFIADEPPPIVWCTRGGEFGLSMLWVSSFPCLLVVIRWVLGREVGAIVSRLGGTPVIVQRVVRARERSCVTLVWRWLPAVRVGWPAVRGELCMRLKGAHPTVSLQLYLKLMQMCSLACCGCLVVIS